MDLEARSLQPNLKAMLLAKLREYKSDLNNLKREMKRISSPNHDQSAREELLEAGMTDAYKVLFKNINPIFHQSAKNSPTFDLFWNNPTF